MFFHPHALLLTSMHVSNSLNCVKNSVKPICCHPLTYFTNTLNSCITVIPIDFHPVNNDDSKLLVSGIGGRNTESEHSESEHSESEAVSDSELSFADDKSEAGIEDQDVFDDTCDHQTTASTSDVMEVSETANYSCNSKIILNVVELQLSKRHCCFAFVVY